MAAAYLRNQWRVGKLAIIGKARSLTNDYFVPTGAVRRRHSGVRAGACVHRCPRIPVRFREVMDRA